MSDLAQGRALGAAVPPAGARNGRDLCAAWPAMRLADRGGRPKTIMRLAGAWARRSGSVADTSLCDEFWRARQVGSQATRSALATQIAAATELLLRQASPCGPVDAARAQIHWLAATLLRGEIAPCGSAFVRRAAIGVAAAVQAGRARRVHAITASRSDAGALGQTVEGLFRSLGLRWAHLRAGLPQGERIAAHRRPIVIGIANEFMADFLRDQSLQGGSVSFLQQRVRALHGSWLSNPRFMPDLDVALLDGADILLADLSTRAMSDARSSQPDIAEEALGLASLLELNKDFTVLGNEVELTDRGARRAAMLTQAFGGEWAAADRRSAWLRAALHLSYCCAPGRDFAIDGGKVGEIKPELRRLLETADGPAAESWLARHCGLPGSDAASLRHVSCQRFLRSYRSVGGAGTAVVAVRSEREPVAAVRTCPRRIHWRPARIRHAAPVSQEEWKRCLTDFIATRRQRSLGVVLVVPDEEVTARVRAQLESDGVVSVELSGPVTAESRALLLNGVRNEGVVISQSFDADLFYPSVSAQPPLRYDVLMTGFEKTAIGPATVRAVLGEKGQHRTVTILWRPLMEASTQPSLRSRIIGLMPTFARVRLGALSMRRLKARKRALSQRLIALEEERERRVMSLGGMPW